MSVCISGADREYLAGPSLDGAGRGVQLARRWIHWYICGVRFERRGVSEGKTGMVFRERRMASRYVCRRARRAWMGLVAMAAVTALSVGGCPKPGGNSGDGKIAGAWTGDVDYTVSVVMGGSAGNSHTFRRPLSVTFSADGQPDVVDVTLDADEVFRVPATGLVGEGDAAEASFDITNPNTGAVTTSTVDATVTSTTRTDTSLDIGLNVSITFSGDTTGTLPGTYSLQASVQPDGKLAWQGVSNLMVGDSSLGLFVHVTSVGILAKQ
jgi:hypothetical protein